MNLDANFVKNTKEEIEELAGDLAEYGKMKDKDIANILITFAENLADSIDNPQRCFTGPNHPLITKRSSQIAALVYIIYKRYDKFIDEKDQAEKFNEKWFADLLEGVED
jgi:hypothetical protein